MNESNRNDDEDAKGRSIEIKEALWVASMSGIGLLFLLLLNRSGRIMAEFTETGISTIPISFWIVTVVVLCLCVSVFFLLKDSKSMEFKVVGIVLTCFAPALATLIIVINIVKL